ncbi:hypothetical protein ACF08B_39000 [Streptomyces sp. NPDC015139]|uniref:hypothetical protein n=1 Tax=Streptomyces sp. NPDC015139 TaxID=3364942 RepID=UPI0036FC868A
MITTRVVLDRPQIAHEAIVIELGQGDVGAVEHDGAIFRLRETPATACSRLVVREPPDQEGDVEGGTAQAMVEPVGSQDVVQGLNARYGRTTPIPGDKLPRSS